MMNYHLYILVLLSATTVATALPLAKSVELGDYEEILVQRLKRAANKIAGVQKTGCSSRSHKVVYDLGQKTYIYHYRACLNHITNLMCYDSRENLPTLCPLSFREQDCIEIGWNIHGSTKRFEICDNFGIPCQKRIPGMGRSDSDGNCTGHQPHPHPHPYPYPCPYPLPHPYALLHPHPHLHPHPAHPLSTHRGQYQATAKNDAKEMGQFDDCFCVTKGKERECHGKNCPSLQKLRKFAEKASKLDDCLCVFNGKEKICNGKGCPQ